MRIGTLAGLVLLLSAIAFAGVPTEAQVNKFVDYLESRPLSGKWASFPLSLFPTLKSQHYPWALACTGKYTNILGKGNIACIQDDGVCYFGSKCYIAKDSTTLYSAERYLFTGLDWVYQSDYIVVTDYYGKITEVLTRNSRTGPYRTVELYADQ
jgi:hypothetical protein